MSDDHAAAWAAYYAQQQQPARTPASAPDQKPTEDPAEAERARAWAQYYASLGYPGYEAYGGTTPAAPAVPSNGETAAAADDAAAEQAAGTVPAMVPPPATPAMVPPPAAPYMAAPPALPGAPIMAPPPPMFAPIMAPPPPLPAELQPRTKEVEFERPGIGTQPGQEEFYRRSDNWPGRGYLVRYVGEAIHRAQETLYNIRHDVLIERRVIGRILGKGGRDLEALQLCTGAEVFIIDKYPPPGEGDDHRLLVLVGRPDQVRLCKEKIDQVLERAREELPPLPPPLTSGWRPVPSVGAGDEAEDTWVHTSGVKRGREQEEEYGRGPHGPPPEYGGGRGYEDRGGGYDRGPPPMPSYGGYDDRGGDGYGYRGPSSQGPPAKKVGNCFDWQRGMCSRGDNCKFQHGPPNFAERDGGQDSRYG